MPLLLHFILFKRLGHGDIALERIGLGLIYTPCWEVLHRVTSRYLRLLHTASLSHVRRAFSDLEVLWVVIGAPTAHSTFWLGRVLRVVGLGSGSLYRICVD